MACDAEEADESGITIDKPEQYLNGDYGVYLACDELLCDDCMLFNEL